MIKFHSDFEIPKSPFQIDHDTGVFLIGSCFTENIGTKLAHYKFSVQQNPNGILFNPQSVYDALDKVINKKYVQEEDLFQLNGLWNSWLHHSRFSAVAQQDALTAMNASISTAHEFLKRAGVIIITLGSAWVYDVSTDVQSRPSSGVAANNHRAPANWFTKRLLSPDETEQTLRMCLQELKRFNENLKAILTVSPVRHVREGMVNNNRSKASLIHAVHTVAETETDVYYFPAYELVIDDLRDYRFYAEDLVHPNYQATNYVWQALLTACFSKIAGRVIEKLDPILSAVAHKPVNPSSEAHQRFVQKTLMLIDDLVTENPRLDLSKEIEYLKQQA